MNSQVDQLFCYFALGFESGVAQCYKPSDGNGLFNQEMILNVVIVVFWTVENLNHRVDSYLGILVLNS